MSSPDPLRRAAARSRYTELATLRAGTAGWAGYGWLACISLALFLALLPFSAYIASLPFLQAEWGLSNTLAGVLFSSYLVGYALASLLVVPLTDRYPPGWVMMGGLALLVASNLLFPLLAGGVWTAALLRGLAGVGHAGAYSPAIRLVSERFPGARRGTAVGLFVAAGYAGTTFSYTFMGLLLGSLPNWQTAYFTTALVGLAALPLAYLAGRDGLAGPVPGQPQPMARGRLELAILADRAVALNTMAYALHTAELYLARLWFPLLLATALTLRGMNAGDAAIRAATLSGLMFMMGIAGVFCGGYLSDRIGRCLAGALCFGLSGLCSLVAGPLVAAPMLLMALGFVYGFATAADSPIYSTSIIEVAPPDGVGSAQAVQAFVGFAVGAMVPVIAGSLLDSSAGANRWLLAFGFNALLAVAGVAALLALHRLPAAARMAGGKR
jgi:MFS family permease